MATQWPLVIFTLCLCLAGGLMAIQGVMLLLGKEESLKRIKYAYSRL